MKNVLVTGGAGFIGSHLVDRLLKEGQRVTVLDNFDSFYDPAIKRQNISAHRDNENFRLIEVDIRDRSALEAGLGSRFDAIVHLAGRGGVRSSIDDPADYYDVNVLGTQNLLEFARRAHVPQFVFASSSSVYGVNPHVPWREDDSALRPISPYAASKMSGELLGHVYSHLYGTRFLALRFFTAYGPRSRPDLAIRRFAGLMSLMRPITIYGDGSSRRDYTYVSDIVEGIRSAIDYDATKYEVINLGNNQTVGLKEMILALETVSGLTAKVICETDQPGDVPQTCADISKAWTLLRYEPRVTFQDGIRQFYHWLVGSRNIGALNGVKTTEVSGLVYSPHGAVEGLPLG
jgi:UDP-glucuronate 4-epimerase